jgi:hypothetical protein
MILIILSYSTIFMPCRPKHDRKYVSCCATQRGEILATLRPSHSCRAGTVQNLSRRAKMSCFMRPTDSAAQVHRYVGVPRDVRDGGSKHHRVYFKAASTAVGHLVGLGQVVRVWFLSHIANWTDENYDHCTKLFTGPWKNIRGVYEVFFAHA